MSASAPGLFVAFEGGEGAGKSTQVRLLAKSLSGEGREVVTTFEPGDTAVGKRLREILLGHDTGSLDPRTEALLYAADRAEHVASMVRPAIDRGAICLSDRYIDSSIAYQGAGRTLDPADIERAAELLADKRALGPSTKKKTTKRAAPRTTKRTVKKGAAKKATAKKAAAKKTAKKP